MMNWMHTDFKIEYENGFLLMIEKLPSGMPREVFSEYQKKIMFPVPSRVPSTAPNLNLVAVTIFLACCGV